MPLIRQLQWDELDLLQGLEVIPTEYDDGAGVQYRVEKQGLVLLISLWPATGVVDVTLTHPAADAILLDLRVAVRGTVRYNNDKRGEYLEFPDCVLVSRLGLGEEEAAFSPNLAGRSMLVAVRPHVSIFFE
ncbi:hypothetical protein D3Y59_16395 [Hymenobacter oligotrophus]|uniref:Uncharacterized protein n=1 Tax=Hymenobacter oligotrophus TaxID=2319843 RepID=A0A3B7QZ35_9BACT|nr:hypothetical protein [Hymenobacter oligotrophus]AYA38488.1 hypothetical protein D3Y59_16395 [Hymenobacter oligotrophus]